MCVCFFEVNGRSKTVASYMRVAVKERKQSFKDCVCVLEGRMEVGNMVDEVLKVPGGMTPK